MQINGTELYYQERGSGPSVLFVHGMCGDADVWDDQIRRLSSQFRCVAYDRRGHTRSLLGDVEQRSVQLHADDAAALIEALDLAPCMLVGSSGGARIGVDVVRRYGRLLGGAVLSEPPLFALDPEDAADFVNALKPRIEAAMPRGGARAAVDAFFDYVCPGLWRQLDEAHREPYRANATELFGDLQMPAYDITVADLENIKVPSLIVTGTDSHPVFRRVAHLLAERIPGADLVELTGSGHVTYVERPVDFARSVEEFSARLGSRRALHA
jgi:pimeloyl-ACP methyl ester carboxylesterase